jgi:uncharacterized protein (TIGR02246 family)
MSRTLDQRLYRLEAESAIRQLIARYSFAIDDHDLEATLALFTADAVLGTINGQLGASGTDGLRDYFCKRFASTGPANHVTHDVDLRFADDEEARGRVSAHAELWRDGQMFVTAFRYDDIYRRTDHDWRIAQRLVSYFYYVRAPDYRDILASERRVHITVPAQQADLPRWARND